MRKKPTPRRGMPGSLFYTMIPLGFLLLVVVMMFVGDQTPGDEPTTIVDEPAADQPADPATGTEPAPAE